MIWKNKSPSPGTSKRLGGKALSTKPKKPCSIPETHLLLACCPLTSTHVAVCIFTCAHTNNYKSNNNKQQQHSSPHNRDDIEDKPQRTLSKLCTKKRTENQTLSSWDVYV